MTKEKKYRLIAALATLLLFVAVMVWLFMMRLGFSAPDGMEWPPADTTGLLMADEYVEIEPEPVPPVAGGDSRPDEGSTPPPPDAQDVVDAGVPAEEVTPVVSSPQPSPVKVTPKTPEKPTGPTQAEIEAKAREQRQKDASAEANNRMKFGKTPGATGTGESAAGSGSGNSQQKGTYSGSGSGNVNGRGVSVSGGIACPVPGKVTVRIWANPAGKVTKAEIIYPTTISDPSVREKCLQRARAAKVTPSTDRTEDERGTITFIFK